MAKIGVPSNEKIFDAFQTLVGEKIILTKGAFFVPFRGHELIFARVEEIGSLTRKGYLDISFITRDHFDESGAGVVLGSAFDHCCCEISIITVDRDFFGRNAKEVFLEFG